MLQKRASIDPWVLPDSLFWPKYHTLYPLYCLETVYKGLGAWKTYCGIHLITKGVLMTLMLLKGVSRYPWRPRYSLFQPNYRTLTTLYCLENMFIKVLGHHIRMGKLIFGIHMIIQGFCMTLILQKTGLRRSLEVAWYPLWTKISHLISFI